MNPAVAAIEQFGGLYFDILPLESQRCGGCGGVTMIRGKPDEPDRWKAGVLFCGLFGQQRNSPPARSNGEYASSSSGARACPDKAPSPGVAAVPWADASGEGASGVRAGSDVAALGW